jgi:hypothetical protein
MAGDYGCLWRSSVMKMILCSTVLIMAGDYGCLWRRSVMKIATNSQILITPGMEQMSLA